MAVAQSTPYEKLQPCLFDRLIDDEVQKKEEGRHGRVISLSEAIRKSHARAMPRPAPAAAPGIAAMVGLGISWSRPLIARWFSRC